jgi:hypothetical protein
MNERRNFLKLASAAAIPAAAAFVSGGVARADDGSANEFLGAWNLKHDLPLPPYYFRELLSFADGGVLHETNTFLHTASKVNFGPLGLTDPKWSALNAADGIGSWERTGNGVVQLVFRKLLFDGNTGVNFGDLLVSGTYYSDGKTLTGKAHVRVVDPFNVNVILADFGFPGSTGGRIVYVP